MNEEQIKTESTTKVTNTSKGNNNKDINILGIILVFVYTGLVAFLTLLVTVII